MEHAHNPHCKSLSAEQAGFTQVTASGSPSFQAGNAEAFLGAACSNAVALQYEGSLGLLCKVDSKQHLLTSPVTKYFDTSDQHYASHQESPLTPCSATDAPS